MKKTRLTQRRQTRLSRAEELESDHKSEDRRGLLRQMQSPARIRKLL